MRFENRGAVGFPEVIFRLSELNFLMLSLPEIRELPGEIGNQFGQLQKAILDAVKEFDSYAMEFPVSWNCVKQELSNMDTNYIEDVSLITKEDWEAMQ